MRRVAVYGASGFGGAELLRLLAGHPGFEVAVAAAASQAGDRVADAYPNLAAAYPDTRFTPTDAERADGLDVAFLALPHGASQALVPDLRRRVGLVVDLAADFRMADPAVYDEWYGEPHRHPELLGEAVFGLPELFREQIPGASLVAVPGCYVTAAALALAPLVRAGAIEAEGVIVDAASGVSGAGREPKGSNHFNTVDGDFRAYGLLRHRHTPEMEQAIGARILFTPHLVPMSRGILATCYARPAAGVGDPLEVLRHAYSAEPFVVVDPRLPSTKATLGSNTAHLTARYDPRTDTVVALCALDNMTKGAAGQAIQCANLALGLPESAGLPRLGLFP
jgi:N-acetyl-gamma-glutamyl-phosphate reductase